MNLSGERSCLYTVLQDTLSTSGIMSPGTCYRSSPADKLSLYSKLSNGTFNLTALHCYFQTELLFCAVVLYYKRKNILKILV